MIRVGTLVCALGLTIVSALEAQFTDSGPGSRTVTFFSMGGEGASLQLVEAGRVPMLRRRISLALAGAPLADALAEIGRLAGVSFAYSSTALPKGERVTLRAEGMTVAAVLTEVLLETGLDVVVSPGDRLLLVRHGETGAPTGTVTGIVTDSTRSAGRIR